MGCLLGRYIQLVTQLASVGNPHANNPRQPDVYFLHTTERKCFVGQIGGGDRLQQFSGSGTLNIKLPVPGSYIRHERVLIIGDVSFEPGFRVPVRRV